jgi:hypothetical protein
MKTSNGLAVPRLAAAIKLGAAVLVAASCTSALAGTATVTFVQPEKFVDLPRSGADRDAVLKAVADHVVALARRQLPADCDLKLEVLDLDLAGRLLPSIRWPGNEVRVLRGGADWPRMTVRYTITRNGQVLASGEDNMANMAYQDHATHYFDDDPLRYEKTMIDDWFRQRVAVAVR